MRKLIELPIEQARRLKWERGRKEHGTIMNLGPTEELYSECLDGINYALMLEMEAHGDKPAQSKWRLIASQLEEIATICKTAFHSSPEFEPHEIPFR